MRNLAIDAYHICVLDNLFVIIFISSLVMLMMFLEKRGGWGGGRRGSQGVYFRTYEIRWQKGKHFFLLLSLKHFKLDLFGAEMF